MRTATIKFPVTPIAAAAHRWTLATRGRDSTELLDAFDDLIAEVMANDDELGELLLSDWYEDWDTIFS